MDPLRLKRLQERMNATGLDAVFVSNPKNVQYLTGFRSMMPGEVQPFGDPEGFALVFGGEVHLLCDGRYFAGVKNLPGVTPQLIETPVTAKTFADKIKQIVGSQAKTIGYERDALLYCDAIGLLELLSGYDCRPAEEMLAGLRIIKTREEVELLRQAQAITSACFEHVAGWIRVGLSEREVALEIGNYLRTHSEGNSFDPIVAFGKTGCHPHYLPDPARRLERGQMVLLDFGSIHNGYCGDMTRMIVMGRADDRQREVYDWVLQAQLRGLEAIRPGATCHAIDAAGRDYFKERGCAEQFAHGTGHGVGLAIHEAPTIKKGFENRVEPGMVFTIEPGLYFENWGGVRIEDMIVVTETGYENLTTTSKTLLEITGASA
ncbi:MAG: M24 family metallopeptidase [Phycisphaerae bacterium]